MSDGRFDVLERYERLVQAPEPSFEGFLRRRDRKRRNQRIAAAVVAIAIFLAPLAWIVATGGPFGHGRTPASPGPTVAPRDAEPIGLSGLAPEGMTPSLPRHGELVLNFFFGHTGGDPGRFSVSVYADGRMISERLADLGGTDEYSTAFSTGLVERRLTPEGVDLVKDEVLSTGMFDHDHDLAGMYSLNWGQIEVHDGDRIVRVGWGDCCDTGSADIATEMATPEQVSALERLDARLADPTSWLPASAWEDPKVSAFVPSRYSVCYEARQGVELSRVLASLPRSVEDLLRTLERTRSQLQPYPPGASLTIWCSAVTAEDARALAQILDDAGIQDRHEDVFGLTYVVEPQALGAVRVSLSFEALLPHQM